MVWTWVLLVIGIILFIVAVVGFSFFMKRVHGDMMEQHKAMDIWQEFFDEHVGYVDEINDKIIKAEYIGYISNLSMSVRSVGDCVQFVEEISEYKMEVYNKYHKHIPSMVKHTRNNRLGDLIDI